jgi:hypothetical protein
MLWIKQLGWCGLFLSGFVAADLQAEQTSAAMTAETIERWLEAAPAVSLWSKQHTHKEVRLEVADITQLSEVFSQQVAATDEAAATLSKLLEPYGFSSYTQWSELFERLVLAVSALHLQSNNIRELLNVTIAQLKSDKDIDQASRDSLLQEYQVMLDTIAVLESVPQSELNLVAPYEPQIRAWLASAK